MMRWTILTLLLVTACKRDTIGLADLDEDDDGHTADVDCNDADPDVNPAAAEVCNGIDDDCDGRIDAEAVDAPTWFADTDRDDHGDAAAPLVACDAPQDHVADATDCDDADGDVHPGADETCNGRDDDCNDVVDDDPVDALTFYTDLDGDGFGDPNAPITACALADGLAANGSDCDDDPTTGQDRHPGVTELCNGHDDDCDGEIDEGAADVGIWYADRDGDGFGDASDAVVACDAPEGHVPDNTDCDDDPTTGPAVHPGATEVCNGVDDDCVGAPDEGAVDAVDGFWDRDGDGFGDPMSPITACPGTAGVVAQAGDCMDTPGIGAAVNPDATEVCNGIDDDCVGEPDEDAVDRRTFYVDADGDRYGDGTQPVLACSALPGLAPTGDDCDDDPITGAAVNPGATEVCNGIDDDCVGEPDEGAIDQDLFYADADGDGWGDRDGTPVRACERPADHVANHGDCDDDPTTGAAVNPGATEVCNGIDDDCSDVVDDGHALGSAPECAAADCVDIRDNHPAPTSGLAWIDAPGSPVQVWCEQDLAGGGWILVWQNHGGAVGGSFSNAELLEQGQGSGLVFPHDTFGRDSRVHRVIWDHVRDLPGTEWLKIGTAWDPTGAVAFQTTIRVELGDVTWDDILEAPSNEPCHPVANPIAVYGDGRFLGQTDLVNSYQPSRQTFGLANDQHDGADACGQSLDNLIHDPDGLGMPRIDGGYSLNGIRHLFSYVHTRAGRDASRCQFGCWDATSQGGWSDAFTWAVR